MDDDQFNKLWEYISQGFAEQNRQTEELRKEMNEKFDLVFGLLDDRFKQVDIEETERMAEISQINRIDNTVQKHEERITKLETQTV